MPSKLVIMKKRPDFLHASIYGHKEMRFGLILQAVKCQESLNLNVFRVGYTASKKMGNAVFRNKAKRRLRVLCTSLLPRFGVIGYDYVVIARRGCVDVTYKDLYVELKRALKKIKRKINEEKREEKRKKMLLLDAYGLLTNVNELLNDLDNFDDDDDDDDDEDLFMPKQKKNNKAQQESSETKSKDKNNKEIKNE